MTLFRCLDVRKCHQASFGGILIKCGGTVIHLRFFFQISFDINYVLFISFDKRKLNLFSDPLHRMRSDKIGISCNPAIAILFVLFHFQFGVVYHGSFDFYTTSERPIDHEILILADYGYSYIESGEDSRSDAVAASIIFFLVLVIVFVLYYQLQQRKQLLSEIERQAVKLRELDQAKSRFFANISHDLRSPLTLMVGALNQIFERESTWMDGESRSLLEVGLKNGQRLMNLADEIMELTRLEEGKIRLALEPVRIVPYMRLLTKMFRSAADIKDIELLFVNRVDEQTIVLVDPKHFEKIIYNLISNALKFTPRKGKIDVVLSAEAQSVMLDINDNGPGISEESLDHIFDRFYQSGAAENAAQIGVGIGLALVKELVELHNGKVDVESSVEGSSFRVHLPCHESAIQEAIIPTESWDVISRNSLWEDLNDEKEMVHMGMIDDVGTDLKRILIVEDHRELRYYIKGLLDSDYQVFLAADGRQAMEILRGHRIDLLLTDLMMPNMNGFELIDQLKKDKTMRSIPVLVISARTDHSEKLDLMAHGIDVIHKPFDKKELKLRVSNMINSTWSTPSGPQKIQELDEEEFEKDIILKIEAAIIKNIADPTLTVADLANEVVTSERNLYRLTRKLTGYTPHELIKESRLQYIRQYLLNHKVHSASKLVRLVGMNNASYFNRLYKKRFGESIFDQIDKESS